jgi:hypothetical protein
MRLVSLSVLVAGSVTAIACRHMTQFSSSGAESIPLDSKETLDGLRYYVARDLILVEVDAKYKRAVQWASTVTGDCAADRTPFSIWHDSQWSLTPVTTADPAAAYRLGIAPASTTQQSLNVAVSDIGLLTSLNYAAHDQTGDIIGNVVKGAAGVAGLVVGLPGPLGESKMVLGVPSRPNDAYCFKKIGGADTLDTAIVRTRRDLLRVRSERLQLLNSAGASPTLEKLRRISALDSILLRRENLIADNINTLTTTRATSLSQFLSEHGVGSKDTVIHLQYLVDATLFPQSVPDGLTFHGAQSLVPVGSFARQLLDSARILLVLRNDSVANSSITAAPPQKSMGCVGKSCARIFFRAPRQRIVELYTPIAADSMAAMALRQRLAMALVKANDPVQSVSFDGQRFADAGFKLAFGKYGNVTSLEQSSGSSLAGLTASVTSAISSARTEFQASLKSAQDIQTTAQAIKESRLASQIKELQDRKAIVDAELALSGANATKDMVAQKQQIDAELALLQSQQSLTNARADSTRGADLADLKDQIERLKIQIQLLTQQLELQKAQANLHPSSQ